MRVLSTTSINYVGGSVFMAIEVVKRLGPPELRDYKYQNVLYTPILSNTL